ncbi:MAG: hypothetical protein AAFR67_14740 [Chloroflexota bacterium]
MASDMTIVQCVSCAGYGWHEDDFTGEVEDCTWCGGVGYVYQDVQGTDHKIPKQDLHRRAISEQLEALEQARLRQMGYTGEAKKPWQQDIREGTKGGENPYEGD